MTDSSIDAGDTTRAALSDRAAQVIKWWASVASGRRAVLLVIGAWAIIAIPAALLHGFQYDEGLTVGIARGAFKDGHWPTPYIYNFRWIERPTFLAWTVAAISLPFGHVSQLTARLPTILCLLGGCLLIWRALLPIASAGAALLGVALFLACPVVLRYCAMSLADIPLAVVLFGAFMVWWNSFVSGRISLDRWILIGCLLAIAALFKGPQPVAYFFLGIGVFTVLASAWWQIPGLVLAGLVAALPVALWYAHVFVPGDQSEWLRYTRLSSNTAADPRPLANAVNFFFQVFPASLLAGALLIARGSSSKSTVPPNFILALSCYAFTSTFIILLWPTVANSRYILPMTLPLCVLGGLAYDALSERWPKIVASGICIALAILGYAAVHFSIEQVLRPAKYRQSIIAGAQIDQIISADPAPLYRTEWSAGQNELPYMHYDVTQIEQGHIFALSRPAWIMVPDENADAMIAKSDGHLKSRLLFDKTALLRLQ